MGSIFNGPLCEIGNVYWFKRENSFVLGTNFRITPLFMWKDVLKQTTL
jgi:hypothetical protein